MIPFPGRGEIGLETSSITFANRKINKEASDVVSSTVFFIKCKCVDEIAISGDIGLVINLSNGLCSNTNSILYVFILRTADQFSLVRQNY